jgi:hypothetical protein
MFVADDAISWPSATERWIFEFSSSISAIAGNLSVIYRASASARTGETPFL